jgi:hypothetical protein
MTLKRSTVALFTCAACHAGETEPPQRVNIEVTGSPQCLANVAGRLDLPAVTMPVWSGRLGRLEFGPVEATGFSKVVGLLRTTKCVQAIRQQPCATGLSDFARPSCSGCQEV